MKVRGIEFSPVFNASGARGFFGEGYWYHKVLAVLYFLTRLPIFRLTFDGVTLVAKTTTLNKNVGNMEMKADGITPKRWFPDCIIVVGFWKSFLLKCLGLSRFSRTGASVLNCLGLSGPGVKHLLGLGLWQKLTEPFFISFSTVGQTMEQKIWELSVFVETLMSEKFKAPFGIILNVSCPNIKHDLLSDNWPEFLKTVLAMLDIAARLNRPVLVKLSLLVPERMAYKISLHRACNGLIIGNTGPYGEFSETIPWENLFGSADPACSPLVALGYKAGGYSGPYLLPLICAYIEALRRIGVTKAIIASGGLDSVKAVRAVHKAGASGFKLGSVCMTAWWNTRPMITLGRQLSWYEAKEETYEDRTEQDHLTPAG